MIDSDDDGVSYRSYDNGNFLVLVFLVSLPDLLSFFDECSIQYAGGGNV